MDQSRYTFQQYNELKLTSKLAKSNLPDKTVIRFRDPLNPLTIENNFLKSALTTEKKI
jgi:hypothetical protein